MPSRLMLRVTLPIAAISLLLLAVGGVAAWYMQRLQNESSDLLVFNVASVRAAEEIEIGMREIQAQLNRFQRSGDPAHLKAVVKIRKETDRWMQEADRLSTTPRENELIARAKEGYKRFFATFSQLAENVPQDVVMDQVEELMDRVLTEEVLRPVHEYLDFNEQMMLATSRQNQVQTDRMAIVLLLLGASGAVAGLLAGFAIARGISRSIVQLSVPIRDATGKLNEVVGPVTVSAGGNFEDLEAGLKRMVDQIGAVVERLQNSQREVLRAEQLAALGQLAAGLAHELRNPLMSLKLLTQTAVERYQQNTLQAKHLLVLDEVASRLEQSVQAFLDFAKPPQLEKRRFDLTQVVDRTVKLISARAERQVARIEWELPGAPITIHADEGQIGQVMLNLLLNALDATPHGGAVRVTVTDQPSALRTVVDSPPAKPREHRAGVTIHLSDTGCGLPAELGERIFEPFVSSKESGLGLGLSICKRIVESHQGEIGASNRPEGGAVFSVWLPLAEELDAGPDRPGDVEAVLAARSEG